MMVFLCYKLFGTHQQYRGGEQLQEQFQSGRRLMLSCGGQLSDKIKSAIMSRMQEGVDFGQSENGPVQSSNQRETSNPYQCNVYSGPNRHQSDQSRSFLASLAVVYVLLVASQLPMETNCLEQVSNLFNLHHSRLAAEIELG